MEAQGFMSRRSCCFLSFFPSKEFGFTALTCLESWELKASPTPDPNRYNGFLSQLWTWHMLFNSPLKSTLESLASYFYKITIKNYLLFWNMEFPSLPFTYPKYIKCHIWNFISVFASFPLISERIKFPFIFLPTILT